MRQIIECVKEVQAAVSHLPSGKSVKAAGLFTHTVVIFFLCLFKTNLKWLYFDGDIPYYSVDSREIEENEDRKERRAKRFVLSFCMFLCGACLYLCWWTYYVSEKTSFFSLRTSRALKE